MPASTTERSVLTVSDLNRQARMTIEERFSMVWVMGEMSNFARHWKITTILLPNQHQDLPVLMHTLSAPQVERQLEK